MPLFNVIIYSADFLMEHACQQRLERMERVMHKMNANPKEGKGMVNVQEDMVYVAYVSRQNLEKNFDILFKIKFI